MKKWIIFPLIAFLLLGCTPDNSAPVISDPAKSIEANTGETFEIVVSANPSTGYHWELAGDLNGVEFISREYKADEPVMPGSGGVEIWVFKAVSAGAYQVTLESYPPGSDAGEDRLIFNLNVK